MSPILAFLPYAAPLALFLSGIIALSGPGQRPARALKLASLATWAALATALATLALLIAGGSGTSPLIGFDGIGLSARVDALSVTMLTLISFLGVIIARYSARYLDGDPGQGRFIGWLCLTLAAVMTLVISGNLVQLVLAWISTSLALHQLLLFYPDRPRARIAARKKFVTARLGDVCLVLAAVLIATSFGATDIATILEAARTSAPDGTTSATVAAALLIALAALLKCAQFPFHGWLPEVMETPTPVSALLHAGIINAGGFLVIRLADLMLLAPLSMHLLAIVGGFTALFAAVVMLTQTSVKVSLAWSTAAQMGFMLLQCGLGLFQLALLHIVAHALYKAHAFLSAGGVLATPAAPAAPEFKPSEAALSLVAALIAFAAMAWIASAQAPISTQELALGLVLVLGLMLYGARTLADHTGWQGALKGFGLGAGVAAIWFGLHTLSGWAFGGLLPYPGIAGPADLAIIALALASFGLATLFQLALPARAHTPGWMQARTHIANGLYVNALFDRLVGAHALPLSNSPSSK